MVTKSKKEQLRIDTREAAEEQAKIDAIFSDIRENTKKNCDYTPKKKISVAERIRNIGEDKIAVEPPKNLVKGRTSSYRGVSFQKQSGQWVASISVGGHTFAEYAQTEDGAAVLYDKMAVRWLRGRAKTNFPISGYVMPELPAVIGVDGIVTSAHIRAACHRYILLRGLVGSQAMENWTVVNNLFFFDSETVDMEFVQDWCRKVGIDPRGMDL